MILEIERKFLCNLTKEQAKKLSHNKSRRIESIYLSNSKENTTRVVKDTLCTGKKSYKWTSKCYISDEVRIEDENPLAPLIYDTISSLSYPSISKTRFFIDIDDYTWEVDFFDDYDFVIAEIEFPNEESAKVFTNLPNWITKEVTNDPSYLNCNLAK